MASIPRDDEKPSMLLVDDDVALCEALARAFESRGFSVRTAQTAAQARKEAAESPPEYAVIDLNLPGEPGLPLVPALIGLDPNTRIVVLTGYGSIATAVEAIKRGATHYLTKPADADTIVRALYGEEAEEMTPILERPMSIERLEWEHISRVLREHNGNISQAARALSMHRRTLQRKLAKRPRKC
jgi:two-component system response regulator RegA